MPQKRPTNNGHPSSSLTPPQKRPIKRLSNAAKRRTNAAKRPTTQAPELLFDPSLIGHEGYGVQEVCF